MYRKTYVEINCNDLENNIREIKKEYNEYKYYIGVVKANCYGHGIESIRYLIEGGINYLATSSLEEALKVREVYKDIPILVLEPIHYDDILVASRNDIRVTIDDVKQFNELLKNKVKIKFHLKINSGMNRFGLKDENDVKYIFDNSNDKTFLEGVFTHLSSGNGNIYDGEKRNFEKLTSLIDINKIPIVHMDRSLTLEQHNKENYCNGVRLGIVMYGFKKEHPSISLKRKIFNKLFLVKDNFIPSKLNIKPVLKFYTEVIEIKDVLKGEIVGYSGMYSATEKVRIALLPYGFADYLFINPSYVSINGKQYRIITNYMDITTIIIDDSVKIGDKVEIFGDNISIKKASNYAKENVYKTICSITNRVPRVYTFDGKKKEVMY